MSATAEYPRADHAANNVDPMMMAQALDHIARTASKSRSQTRRIRWIALRAEYALAGREYRDIDVDLPKDANNSTPERLQKRLAFHIALKHQLREALQHIASLPDSASIEDARNQAAVALRADQEVDPTTEPKS